MKPIRSLAVLLLAIALTPSLLAQTVAAKGAAPSQPAPARLSVAPLPAQAKAASSHAPFEAGDCTICHQNADPKQPGPVRTKGPELCLSCHEEFVGVMKRAHIHEPARGACTNCHSPHNASYAKLLLKEPGTLCSGCHEKVAKIAAGAKVKHKALSSGAQCTNCHNPHGSAREKLVMQASYDLCLSCHNVDTMKDANGKKLQNIKAWLDKNRVRHGPVRSKDCTGCHQPHGGDHFRLLEEDYPAEFYAAYDARTYALCFSCHNDEAFSAPQTTTLTQFRNGATNLHYVHLQQSGRGRTCRACHEVHASNQQKQVRDGVPYGSGGWMLKLNYKETPDGGLCAKTCHAEKQYVNK